MAQNPSSSKNDKTLSQGGRWETKDEVRYIGSDVDSQVTGKVERRHADKYDEHTYMVESKWYNAVDLEETGRASDPQGSNSSQSKPAGTGKDLESTKSQSEEGTSKK
ncbi:MAG: hypothetical protein M1828_005174 [Chrysothrix sp. TS-e1954]|nr:MAG: hypothetical protein M1828_005174 [Chrysothrix sp. TS-e1954]